MVLQKDPDSTCGDIMERAEQKLADINQRIDDLTKMWDALKILTDGCSSDATSAECPIMQAITDE